MNTGALIICLFDLLTLAALSALGSFLLFSRPREKLSDADRTIGRTFLSCGGCFLPGLLLDLFFPGFGFAAAAAACGLLLCFRLWRMAKTDGFSKK